jgi:predicted dehydrogenase
MDGPGKSLANPPRETIRVPVHGELYGIEADTFAECVLDGKAPWITPADTLGNMQVLDQIKEAFACATASPARA